jgi:hypothetical protein
MPTIPSHTQLLMWEQAHQLFCLLIFIVGGLIPILWITKEIMSRGPHVTDMEC